MRAIALVLERRHVPVAELRERREHAPQLAADIVVEPFEPAGIEAANELVERIDKDTERHVAFDLGGRAREHHVALRAREHG